MDVGVTVGDSIERLERTGDPFDFVEVGVGEAQPLPTDAAAPELREALAATNSELCVHPPSPRSSRRRSPSSTTRSSTTWTT